MADHDPGRGAFERRVEALLSRYRDAWCGEIEVFEGGAFQRGFFSGMWLSASTLVQHADRLWRLWPSRYLQLHRHDVGDASAQLAACPALARYRSLIFRGGALDDEDLVQLASSPHLAELEELELEDCDIGDGGQIALARAPQLGKLRVLDLGCRIETLRLRRRRLGEALGPVLAAFPALTELDLSETRLGTSGVARLAALPLRPRSLGLNRNNIYVGGAYALARSPILDGVETLNVSSNPMGEAGALALVTSPHLRALRCLVYGGEGGIPNAAVVAAIAHALPWLEELVLPFANIGPEGAGALAAGNLPNLTRLELFADGIGDAGAIAIARSTALPSLRSLDVSANGLTDTGALAFAESPHLAELDILRIRSTPLRQHTVDALRARFGRRVDVNDSPAP